MLLNNMWKKYQKQAMENISFWCIVSIMMVLSLYMEVFVTAAKRPFSVVDPKISNPFTEHEKYDDLKLFSLAVFLPLVLFTVITIVDSQKDKFQRFYKTTSCFSFSLAMTVFLTTFLKVRLAKLRPDFLARCGPKIEALKNSAEVLFTEEICSAPLGARLLNDGYKSNPSGHSAISMSTMCFLSLWFHHSYGKSRRNGLLTIACFLPILAALDVMTSRIYDFRHDYFDILTGGLLGLFCSILSVHFITLDVPSQEDMILPV